jgi:exodeoxyribonuclease-5
VTITPSDKQWEAIKAIKAWYKGGASTPQVFNMQGLAGVGKSTIYDFACKELNLKRRVTTAYCGKAALNLVRKGVPDAMTGHAAMYIPIENEDTGEVTFQINMAGPAADADLIGIDESSMVPDDMAKDYLSFHKKILAMGDPGQLPPVNGDAYFNKLKHDVFLDEIHRQAADNPIIRLAHMARNQQAIAKGDYGAGVQVIDLTKETQPLVYRDDTQVLCGIHRVRHAYTQRIRRMRGFDADYPMKGERILCVKNDKDHGLLNGMQGTLIGDTFGKASGDYVLHAKMDDIETEFKKLTVVPYWFNEHFSHSEKPRFYKSQLQFDWGNILTVHKAQGSEWPHVTIVDDSGAFRDERWKWLYTALTRSSGGMILLQRGERPRW